VCSGICAQGFGSAVIARRIDASSPSATACRSAAEPNGSRLCNSDGWNVAWKNPR
jgi:hypothetical protein